MATATLRVSALWPKRWITPTAFRHEPCARARPGQHLPAPGSKVQLRRSLLGNTSVAPMYTMAFTEATKVSVGESTWSPVHPDQPKAEMKRGVPLETATVGSQRQCENSASNASMFGPTLDSEVVAITSWT